MADRTLQLPEVVVPGKRQPGRPNTAHVPCPDCGVARNDETAYRVGVRKDGAIRYSHWCKKCHRAYQRRIADPAREKARKAERRREAGIVPLSEREPRTHCRLGHPMEGLRRGRPRCLICHREQARRAARARGVRPQTRTHCPQGHEYTAENTLWKKGTQRRCALCHRMRQRRRYDQTAREYVAIIVNDPCVYCGQRGGTIEHIKAIARGGGDDWDNLAGACHSCNAQKRTIDLLPFLLRRISA